MYLMLPLVLSFCLLQAKCWFLVHNINHLRFLEYIYFFFIILDLDNFMSDLFLLLINKLNKAGITGVLCKHHWAILCHENSVYFFHRDRALCDTVINRVPKILKFRKTPPKPIK